MIFTLFYHQVDSLCLYHVIPCQIDQAMVDLTDCNLSVVHISIVLTYFHFFS
jgi:hypothetical protein